MKIEFTRDEQDRIENLISYYQHHGVENIQDRHPEFVVEDFNTILKLLADKLEEGA